MNRERFSAVAHGDIKYWNPIGAERLERLIAHIELPTEAQVLDIGSGRGALLREIALRHPGIAAVGVDPSPFATQLAQSAVAGTPQAQQMEFVQAAYSVGQFADASQDLVLVMGSSHALGGLADTLTEARRLLKPGGQLLLAEGYWQHKPGADYLAFLHMAEADQSTHEGNIGQFEQAGFALVEALTCNQAEWDDYENSYAANMLRYLDANPQESEADAWRERITTWHQGYLRWGRGVLGFAVYLLRV